MKIFVTGHKGYIGSHLIPLLLNNGHHVTGCDIDLFKGCEWSPLVKPHVELIKDIRDITINDLVGNECVIHLAALSNDPMGDLDPQLTYSINREGSINLARISKEAGIKRFLFSSSCSIYGKGEKLDLKETDSTNPVSPYAESKIDTEKALFEMSDKDFSPVSLRNATAYGCSPMFRNDLVVNNLLSCAFVNGNIQIKSDGEPWRPIIHCSDIAKAFSMFAIASKELIHNQIVNIGGNSENYQVKNIADKVQEHLPQANIIYTGEIGEDPRNYRVKFDRFNSLFPDFRLEYNLHSGIKELLNSLKLNHFSIQDFDSTQFNRLKKLKSRLHLIQ